MEALARLLLPTHCCLPNSTDCKKGFWQDPDNTIAGTITDVVKHTKSNKLKFKVYDNQVFPDGPPPDKADYSYLVVSWAIKSCKFHKVKRLSRALHCRPKPFEWRRPRQEWYQQLPLRANSAAQVPPAPTFLFGWRQAHRHLGS